MKRLQNIKNRLATLDTRAVKPPPRAEKVVDPHYLTPEHRAWRERGVQQCGGYCQDPACKTPNRRPSRLFADHIKEKQDGGALFDDANRMMKCGSCHTRKTLAERARRLTQA